MIKTGERCYHRNSKHSAVKCHRYTHSRKECATNCPVSYCLPTKYSSSTNYSSIELAVIETSLLYTFNWLNQITDSEGDQSDYPTLNQSLAVISSACPSLFSFSSFMPISFLTLTALHLLFFLLRHPPNRDLFGWTVMM